MSDQENSQLYQQINEHFNLQELRTLCLHLGMDYDDFPSFHAPRGMVCEDAPR